MPAWDHVTLGGGCRAVTSSDACVGWCQDSRLWLSDTGASMSREGKTDRPMGLSSLVEHGVGCGRRGGRLQAGG